MMLHNLYYIAFNYATIESGNPNYKTGTFNFGMVDAYNQIASGTNAVYNAREGITLKAGFKAVYGSNFDAKIVPDATSYKVQQYKNQNVTVCGTFGRKAQPQYVQLAEQEFNITFRVNDKPVNTDNVVIVNSEADEKMTVQLFPNPSSDNLNIRLNNFTGAFRIELFNVGGEITYRQQTTENNILIDTRSIPNGLHMLKVYNNGTLITTEKIIIQH
jgi:hypothetical protein